jgi:hypothetical protein
LAVKLRRALSGEVRTIERLFLNVLDRELAQHIFDDLAHLAKGMIADFGLQVAPAFAVTALPPFACPDHVEHRNKPRVAGEGKSALDPVVREQQARHCKSLKDLGQCFMGQPVKFGQLMGAERTLVLCQMLRGQETVTRSPN